MESRELAKQICEALADKKGEDIKILNISEVTVLADYFIIASGSNRNQVQAMADNVEETLGKLGHEPTDRGLSERQLDPDGLSGCHCPYL